MKVDKFVVAGASKRGWTTWSTAAVDKRVVAIVPIVIDLLNVVPSFQHHYGAYGFWAPAVGDYVQMGIMNWMGTPEFAALMKIEEPYEYRDRLTMPKFVLNSAGDQFFLPDSTQFYWDDLKGPKYLRYVPNTDHSMKNSDALQSLVSFHDSILRKKQLPEYSWELPSPGVIRVVSKTKPSRVKLWTATNPEARDFRLETLGPKYREKILEPEGDGIYEATLDNPEKGWTAGFIELTYDNEPAPFKFTSGVAVIPDTLPHKGKFEPDRSKITSKKNLQIRRATIRRGALQRTRRHSDTDKRHKRGQSRCFGRDLIARWNRGTRFLPAVPAGAASHEFPGCSRHNCSLHQKTHRLRR